MLRKIKLFAGLGLGVRCRPRRGAHTRWRPLHRSLAEGHGRVGWRYLLPTRCEITVVAAGWHCDRGRPVPKAGIQDPRRFHKLGHE